MAPTKRFPDGPVTPHGAYHILHDRVPQMGLRSYDDSVVFNMMGGLAIPDRINAPGRAELKDLKGLIAPWRTIDQKGATQDGVTFVDALYDPIMVELEARIKGRNPTDCRRVYSAFVDSLDAKQQSTLWWFTHQLGYWWAPVRWFGGAPPNPVGAIKDKTQDVSLRLRADNGFWQSYPSVDEFVFAYDDIVDDFTVDDPDDLGTNWTIDYENGGTGFLHAAGGSAISDLAGGRRAIARRNTGTATDDQVISIVMGTFDTWYHPTDANVRLWGRMNTTGTPGTSGIRLMIQRHLLRLSYFSGGTETVIRETNLVIPPRPGESWRLVLGVEGDPRMYRVMRGGATIMTVKETGTATPLGAANRGTGFEMAATGTMRPPAIRRWAGGDNATVTQSKFLERINVGDQPMWDRYTCFGPGTFHFWNGPNAGANEYVVFGPLLPGQIMQLRTDPRKRGVRDMTIYPATPAQQQQYHNALTDFVSFLISNSVGVVEDVIGSLISLLTGGGQAAVPPQGNPYSLLKGRWSKPIPAKSPGSIAQPYHVKVEIVDGNADSKIIAVGTPQRRLPY